MDFRSRSNQPQPARPAGQAARQSYEENTNNGNSNGNGSMHMNTPRPDNKRLLMIAGVALVVIVLLVFGLLFAKNKFMGVENEIKKDKFQAVFLTNGQVYFCKLAQIEHGYAKCQNIYYLQVQQAVQPADSKDKKDEQPQVSLTKLGNELHGPEDSMYIARDQILFWENLKDDGKVAQAIKEHQTKK